MRRARVDSLVHLLLLCTIGLTVNAVTIPYDGVGNNQLYPQRGAAESPYLRLMAPAYAGTHAEPSGPNRPNPRIVSNALFHYGSSTISPEGRSDWIGVWGLYIHLDTTLADRNASESCAINVPTGDTVFDPHSQGGYQIPMIRTSVIPNSTDPRQAGSRVLSNGFSSYLDASGIYGVNSQSQSLVRLFRGGLLRTQIDPVAGEIPIYDPTTKYLLFSHSIINVCPQTVLIYTLLIREHNRMAKIITKDFGFDVAADDEAIFQYTRRYIIALIQKITYEQYLPAVLGVLMPVYNDTMYDPQIDPSVDLFFANVAMRYGHTATSSVVMRLNENGTVIPQSHILLRDSTFNLSYIFEAGLEPIARGFLFQPEQMVDYHFVEDIRSYLPINAPDGFDLAAIGIERGRELGLPDYNAARAFFNLSSISSYADLISDPHIQSILSSLYPNISDLDAYVGAMCEPPNPPAIFGSLIQSSIYDQFTRLRAGDRFFYRRSGVLDSYLSSKLSTMNLGQLVQMNLNIQYFPRNPFVVPQVSDIPAFFKGLSVQDTSTQDLSQTSAGYSYLFTSDYRISWDIRQTDGYIDITLEYNGTGWFGFGLGVDMSNADIYIVDYNSSTTVTVLDCYSSNFQQPNLDTDLGGVNNVMNLRTVVGATSGSRVVVSFSRLLNTGDQYDFVITQSTMPVIFAFTDTQTLGYHGPLNRGHALINFFDLSATNVTATGTASSPDSIFFLKALHGATMFISFGMMAPLSTFVARYSTKMDSWLNIHQAMSSFIFIQVLIAAASAIVGGYATDKGSVHAVLGFTTAGLICICTISGIITAGWKNVPFVLNNTYWVRAVHNTSAYICVVLGIINGYYGLVKITAGWSYSLVIINLYITWMVIFPTALLFYGEYSLRNKAASSQPDSGNLNTVKLQALPNFTWEDINSRVVLGSKWIVVFNVIYDLGSFIEKHPGGSNLLNHIGMDATLEFQGQNPGSHPHSRLAHFILSGFAVGRLSATQAMNLSSAGLMTRERSVKKTEELKTVVASMFRPSTVKQSKDPETGGKDSRPPGGSQPPVGVINPLQYTLLKISSRTLVSTPRSSREIYLIVCDFARSEDTVCFRPGDHVAFQYVASNGDVVTRHYTPIECTCVGSLKIFVKIYPNGKMSQYLKSASCIRVRGPLSDPMIKFNPMHPHGCFDRLGLICGGSGITPMLLILDYYSKYGQQHLSPRATSSVISMVITNHSEDDIFGQDILQRYQREFGSSLTITNLVHQVNTSWSGRKGRLDKCVLVETMPEPCSVKLDVQMTARAPRQSVGIGRIMFSAQGDNFVENSQYVEQTETMRDISTASVSDEGAASVVSHIMICGPKAMITSVLSLLQSLKYSDDMISIYKASE